MQLQHTATLQVLHELSKMSRIAGKDAKSHLIKPDSFKDRPHGMDILTLQHTAAHCNTLQHVATRCNTLQRTAFHVKPDSFTDRPHGIDSLQHTVTHCNSATHSNAL